MKLQNLIYLCHDDVICWGIVEIGILEIKIKTRNNQSSVCNEMIKIGFEERKHRG